MITYRQLRDQINSLPEDQLDNHASVLVMDSDEVLPVMDFVTNWNEEREEHGVDQVEGILDDGHPYLTIEF